MCEWKNKIEHDNSVNLWVAVEFDWWLGLFCFVLGAVRAYDCMCEVGSYLKLLILISKI